MNVLGVCLNPLDWQIRHGQQAVDPDGVKFDPTVPVRLDFEQECGYAKVEQTGNGGLYATITITAYAQEILRRDHEGGVKLALEVSHDEIGEDETVTQSTLVCVAICDKLNDDAQPAAEVIE